MKTTRTCPKCRSTDVLRIPGGPKGWTATGYNVIVAGMGHNIFVTRFVCAACGFSEEWIESKEDIQTLRRVWGAP
jgi:hypothetical protein